MLWVLHVLPGLWEVHFNPGFSSFQGHNAGPSSSAGCWSSTQRCGAVLLSAP